MAIRSGSINGFADARSFSVVFSVRPGFIGGGLRALSVLVRPLCSSAVLIRASGVVLLGGRVSGVLNSRPPLGSFR